MLNTEKIAASLAILFTSILSAAPLLASDFHSPRTAALGGAGHAGPLLTDAIYLNPSFTSFIQTHSLSLNYTLYNPGPGTPPAGIDYFHGHNINLGVLDGMSDSLFQAGVSYTAREDVNFVHVVASKALGQRYSLGLGTKFILPNDGSGARYLDLTASVTAIFAKWLQTTLIVDNLVESATSFGIYREYILGTKINIMGITLLYADPHLFSDQTFGYEMGAEFPFFTDLYLRLGMFKNSVIPYEARRGDGYGIGVGWIAPKITFDYAIAYATIPIPAISHTFGLTVYF